MAEHEPIITYSADVVAICAGKRSTVTSYLQRSVRELAEALSPPATEHLTMGLLRSVIAAPDDFEYSVQIFANRGQIRVAPIVSPCYGTDVQDFSKALSRLVQELRNDASDIEAAAKEQLDKVETQRPKLRPAASSRRPRGIQRTQRRRSPRR